MKEALSFSYSKINKLDSSTRDKIASLWHSSFGDRNEYIRFMLDDALTDEHVFMAYTGQTLCSMLISVSISYKYEEISEKASYFYAVTTKDEFRGNHISAKLMEYAEKILCEDGTQLFFLVPASDTLVHYYEKLGYKITTFCERSVIKPENNGYNWKKSNISERLYEIYLSSEINHSHSFIKSKKIFFAALGSAVFDGEADIYLSRSAFAIIKYTKPLPEILVFSENNDDSTVAASLLNFLGIDGGLLLNYSTYGKPYCMTKGEYRFSEYIYTSLLFE